jgi:hypothetical protein
MDQENAQLNVLTNQNQTRHEMSSEPSMHARSHAPHYLKGEEQPQNTLNPQPSTLHRLTV